MNKAITIASIIASVLGLAAVIVAGIKLAGHDYDVVLDGVIIAVCLAVLLICAISRASKKE